MRLRLLFTFALGLVLVLASSPASAAMQFEAVLNGASEVGPTPSPATGTGMFTLNDAETQLTIYVEYSGLLAPETGAHIHGPATTAQNAGIQFGLPLGSPKNAVWAINATQVGYLKSGLLYVNVHSQAYPGGEIRGQIVASTPAQARTWGRLKAMYSATAR